MKQLNQVSIKMIDNTTYYVPLEEFNVGGVPEQPWQVIGGYMHGSRNLMLRVNTAADFSGSWTYVNPKLIVNMTPTWA